MMSTGKSFSFGSGSRFGSVSQAPPGSSVLTVTPVPARSAAKISVADSSAALVTP